jgi:hypothetical protein
LVAVDAEKLTMRRQSCLKAYRRAAVVRRGYTIGDASPHRLNQKILRPLNYGRRAQTGDTASSGATAAGGEATGGLGFEPPPHLPPGLLMGFVQNRREIFWDG